MEYLDFELEIQSGSRSDYPVTVLHSPAGEARAIMRFPLDQPILERYLAKLPDEKAGQELGQALFEALLTGEVRNRYDVSRERVAQNGQGLRVKLRIQAPELAALPWELMYDARQAEFICFSRETPIVRYLELPQSIPSLKINSPLRILGLIASPCDLVSLDAAREKERIERAVAALQERGLVELTWLEGQTWRDLQHAMQDGPWHVLHFVGHGGFDPVKEEGFVCLADAEGRTHHLPAGQLARLLADHRSLRLVVLNTCEGARSGEHNVFSSTASILVRRGIPAVLAMQYPIADCAAIEFAQAFYAALARGLPVDAAVAEARKAVSLEVTNTAEWAAPVLFMRTPDGVLFELPTTPEEPPTTTPEEPPTPPPPVSRRRRLWPLVVGVIGLLLAGTAILTALRHMCIVGSTMVSGKDGMTLMCVPAGDFSLGPADSDPQHEPQHKVTLDAYWIDRTEVTNAMFTRFVQVTGYRTEAEKTGRADRFNVTAKDWEKGAAAADWQHPLGPTSNLTGLDKHPVVDVSWNDAKAYCEWAGRRLPTEAEWEKAARGTDGRKFPWGDGPVTGDRLNSADRNLDAIWADKSLNDGYPFTAPVGSYPAGISPYGALDMAGNVWEWVADSYDATYYANSPARNPQGPAAGEYRVLRGGSWSNAQAQGVFSVTNRRGDPPAHTSSDIGFRCALSP